jgi:hypothetical protein
MITAKVNRPVFDPNNPTDPKVKLTATVSHGSVSKQFDLNLIVRMQGVSDSQAVILDLNELIVPTETKQNLVLPIVGKNGSTISWNSSDAATVKEDGTVERPAYDKGDSTVTLTATCTKGTEKQTQSFTVKVIHWTLAEEVAAAAELVNWALVKGTNTDSQAIADNLVLPGSIGRSVATTWTIVSSSAGTGSTTGIIDISTGVVTRPTYTQGQVSVQIKCTLTKQTETRDVTLNPFILSPAPMTDSEVLASATTLLESSKFLGTNSSLTQVQSDMQLPYRLVDANASRATIAWSLVTATTHTAVTTSPYIALSTLADYCLADVTRPASTVGNITIGLKATLTINSLTNTKYFDLTILSN